MEIFKLDGELASEAKDVLYEIGNVGVATAIIPIGNIRKMECRVSVPQVFSADADLFSKIAYDPDQVVIGVNTKMDTAFGGSILFLLSMDFVKNTVEIMLEEKVPQEELLKNEDSLSAIHEIINYMTAGYVKVIGEYLNVPMYIAEAYVGAESVKDIINETIQRISPENRQVACVDTRFSIVDQTGVKSDENGQILIFPGQESIEGLIHLMED